MNESNFPFYFRFNLEFDFSFIFVVNYKNNFKNKFKQKSVTVVRCYINEWITTMSFLFNHEFKKNGIVNYSELSIICLSYVRIKILT